MGSVYSVNCSYHQFLHGFNEVDSKISWKVNLIVEINGKCKVIVTDIQPATDMEKLLILDKNNFQRQLIYYYSGSKIILPDNVIRQGGYKIIMCMINDAKIGGSKSKQDLQNFDEIEIEEDLPDFTKEKQFTVKKCECSISEKNGSCDECGHKKIISGEIPEKYLEDNIAD